MAEYLVKNWSMILKIKSLIQHSTTGQSVPGLTTETCVSFLMKHLSSYNNIFQTETQIFWANMKVFLGHLHTS